MLADHQDNQSEISQSEADGAGGHKAGPSRSQARTTSRVSNQSSHSKNKRSSIASLPASLLNLGDVSTLHGSTFVQCDSVLTTQKGVIALLHWTVKLQAWL